MDQRTITAVRAAARRWQQQATDLEDALSGIGADELRGVAHAVRRQPPQDIGRTPYDLQEGAADLAA